MNFGERILRAMEAREAGRVFREGQQPCETCGELWPPGMLSRWRTRWLCRRCFETTVRVAMMATRPATPPAEEGR